MPTNAQHHPRRERQMMTCSRCGHVTDNNNQGHFWAFCAVTGTRRDFHFCCPGNCELEAPRV